MHGALSSSSSACIFRCLVKAIVGAISVFFTNLRTVRNAKRRSIISQPTFKQLPQIGAQLCLMNFPFFCPVRELYSVSRNASSLMKPPEYFFHGSKIFACLI